MGDCARTSRKPPEVLSFAAKSWGLGVIIGVTSYHRIGARGSSPKTKNFDLSCICMVSFERTAPIVDIKVPKWRHGSRYLVTHT